MYLLLALALLAPQDYDYDDIKAVLNSEWELTEAEFIFALDKPEMPEHQDEIKYHTTAVIYKGDKYRVLGYELKLRKYWWRVRVTMGEFEHVIGWIPDVWRTKFSTKVSP